MICWLTNLNETSRCWRSLESTIIKNISDSLCVLLRERSDSCLKLRLMLRVSCWHQFAGMFLSFIISTQCQRLKNREDSSKYCHCPMLQLPVWQGSCFFQRVCRALRQPLDFLLSFFISTPLVLVQWNSKTVCSDAALTSTWQRETFSTSKFPREQLRSEHVLARSILDNDPDPWDQREELVFAWCLPFWNCLSLAKTWPASLPQEKKRLK